MGKRVKKIDFRVRIRCPECRSTNTGNGSYTLPSELGGATIYGGEFKCHNCGWMTYYSATTGEAKDTPD